MAKKRGFLAGAAIGAAIAGGLALLFAPKAGSELREDIATKADELSRELDKKIAQVKKQTEKLDGDAKSAKLEVITKAEVLKNTLDEKSKLFGMSGKNITKAAARETDKLLIEGKALLKDLNQKGSVASKEIGSYAKKAAKSGSKVAKIAKKEFKKDTTQPAK